MDQLNHFNSDVTSYTDIDEEIYINPPFLDYDLSNLWEQIKKNVKILTNNYFGLIIYPKRREINIYYKFTRSIYPKKRELKLYHSFDQAGGFLILKDDYDIDNIIKTIEEEEGIEHDKFNDLEIRHHGDKFSLMISVKDSASKLERFIKMDKQQYIGGKSTKSAE